MKWTKENAKRRGYYFVGRYLTGTLSAELEGHFQYAMAKVVIDASGGRYVSSFVSIIPEDDVLWYGPVDPPSPLETIGSKHKSSRKKRQHDLPSP